MPECKHCNGTGMKPLSEKLKTILRVMSPGEDYTVKKIHELLNKKICKGDVYFRLKALLNLELVDRTPKQTGKRNDGDIWSITIHF